jgi:hypothetical protein
MDLFEKRNGFQKAIKGAREATIDPMINCGILFTTGRIKLNKGC